MVTGSDSVSRMSVPTCLVQFKVSSDYKLQVDVDSDCCHVTCMFWFLFIQMEDPSAGGESGSTVTVELGRESLDTILDGLGRIRDQLSVVAGK